MKIRFTYAQMKPLAKKLQKLGAGPAWCPKGVEAERWKKIRAGKVAHLEFHEMEGMVHAIGWGVMFDVIRDNPKRKPSGKKAGK